MKYDKSNNNKVEAQEVHNEIYNLKRDLEENKRYIESLKTAYGQACGEIDKLKKQLEKSERIKGNFELMFNATRRENDLLEKMNKMLETKNEELKTENITFKKKYNSQWGGGGDSAGGGSVKTYKSYGGGSGGVQNEGTILIT